MLKLNICIFKFKLFKNITEYFLPKKPFQAFYFSALVAIMTKTWTHTESIAHCTQHMDNKPYLLVVSSSTDGCCLFWSSFWNVWPPIVRTTPYRTPPVMLLHSLHPANTVYSEWYQIKIDLTQNKLQFAVLCLKFHLMRSANPYCCQWHPL